jgi:hypothetical protein
MPATVRHVIAADVVVRGRERERIYLHLISAVRNEMKTFATLITFY